MKPNFYQQVVILVYMIIFAILCIFFVPFGTTKIYYDSIFSDEGHLVTFRFLTEILVFTIPAVILYKVSANSKDPNYSLFELLTFKTKKSFWLYSIVILFIVVPYFYIDFRGPSAEEIAAYEKMKQDSIAVVEIQAIEASAAAEEAAKVAAAAQNSASAAAEAASKNY